MLDLCAGLVCMMRVADLYAWCVVGFVCMMCVGDLYA